ncbi:type VI secretion system-associated protein TagO [Lysobacter sp. UC]|uniref:Type VI secretion system-associated protein TagO n=2 Tax=Lysobacter arvi TaxID=3038776 RepID=A0ABU1CE69_9GAMM|nr:type VI secretion system-associated protein TagO [Lysobacter arvi]
MRHWLSIPLMLGVAVSACSRAPSPSVQALSACTVVRDPADRLACFDRAAGTTDAVVVAALTSKPMPVKAPSTTADAESVPPIVNLVEQVEADRAVDDRRARARDFGADGTEGHHRYVISIPTPDMAPRAWLAISCIEAISRLQLVVSEPVDDAQARIALNLDGRPLTGEQRWQVLGQGRVIDAGRGLVAIETLRRIGNGEQLRMRSDVPALDGLTFNANGLSARIAEQRRACRW